MQFFINFDRTLNQREIEMEVRDQYKKRVAEGNPNIINKLKNGVPSIASKN